MNQKIHTKIIRHGDYMAEIQIVLTYTDCDWSPYLDLAAAQKLDRLRQALQNQDLQTATQLGRVYRLIPVEV